MRVEELWRYPVKSLRGEQLGEADVGTSGIPGDRLVHVRLPGRVATARFKPKLLGLAGSLGADGEPLIDGRRWDDPRALEAIRTAAGPNAELVRYDGLGPQRFDVLPLTIATDGAIASMGFDRRRFRPNILVGGVEGFEEWGWPGRNLRVGGATIHVQKLRSRCVMTTFHPDTLEQDQTVLQRIVDELDGKLALDCYVIEPGRVAVGDSVELAD